MNERHYVDPDALEMIVELLEKSKSGKLKWEPTAEGFAVAIGGEIAFHISKAEDEAWPSLEMIDEEGKVVWEVRGKDAEYDERFDELYRIARNIGYRLNERVESVLKNLKKL